MSEQEQHIGKLSKVNLHGATIEEFAKEYCNFRGTSELSSYNKTWTEQLMEDHYDKYFRIGDQLWTMEEHEELDPYSEINYYKMNEDGTVNFVTSFHNGGACLSEMIEEGMAKLLKQK